MPFKLPSMPLLHSSKLSNRPKLNECKLNKNKLELKMKEREWNNKLLEKLSVKRRRDSFWLREIKKELLTKLKSLKRKKLPPELPRRLSTKRLQKQWKSKDWHMKKKKGELLLKS